MADQLQLRGGDTASNDSFTGAQRELSIDTQTNQIRLHDGVTAGGHKVAKADSPEFTGDANFEGVLRVDAGNPNEFIRLAPAGNLQVHRATATVAGTLWSGYGAGTVTSKINSDGSATFGSDNIQLNADGSASFAGRITQGPEWDRSVSQNQAIIDNGTLHAKRQNTSDPIIRGYLGANPGDNSDLSVEVNADGSASFAGGHANISGAGVMYVSRDSGSQQLFGGGFGGDNTKFQVFADGSASFAGGKCTIDNNGQVSSYAQIADQASFKIRNIANTEWPTKLFGDGSATFAGDVTVRSLNTDPTGGAINSTYQLSTSSTNVNHGLFIGSSDYTNASVGNSTASISGDGSASFVGGQVTIDNDQIQIGNTANKSISLRRDTGAVRVSSDNETTVVFAGQHNTSTNAKIYANGSADFAGNIKEGFFGYIEPNGSVTIDLSKYGHYGSMCTVTCTVNGNATAATHRVYSIMVRFTSTPGIVQLGTDLNGTTSGTAYSVTAVNGGLLITNQSSNGVDYRVNFG